MMHEVQLVEPTVAEYFPPAQIPQCAVANEDAKVPTGHATQSDSKSCKISLVPGSLKYLPEIHEMQIPAPKIDE